MTTLGFQLENIDTYYDGDVPRPDDDEPDPHCDRCGVPFSTGRRLCPECERAAAQARRIVREVMAARERDE